jgi:hypothetical protein
MAPSQQPSRAYPTSNFTKCWRYQVFCSNWVFACRAVVQFAEISLTSKFTLSLHTPFDHLRSHVSLRVHSSVNAAALAAVLDFWKLVRSWTDDKVRSLPFPLDSLRCLFESRMNPPRDLPSSFDADLYALHRLTANVIPPCTTDTTPSGDFSRPFLEEEVDWAKRRVRKHSLNSAKGIDGISYDRVVNFPTADLTALFNMCVEKCDLPQVWLTTLLVGILKPGRSALAPDNYRLIALECCLLKFMTLLVDRRLGKLIDE